MKFPILVHDYLALAAERTPDKEAVICGELRLTYRDLQQQSEQLAGALMKGGVQKGDRVIVFLDNSAETMIAIFGILQAGAAYIVLNSSVKSKRLAYILSNSDARAIVTHTTKAKVVTGALSDQASGPLTIWVGDQEKVPPVCADRALSWGEILAAKHETHVFPRLIDLDLASLIYTSGSTGDPKGVISTHHNMLTAARSIIQYLENTPDDIVLNVLPLSFDYGLYQALMSVIFGGTIIIEKSFLFMHTILQRIAEEKVTGFPIVPAVLAMLLKMEDFKDYDLSPVRYMSNTGAALPVEHIRRIREMFPHVHFYSMFGLTECKRVGYLSPEELDLRPDSVGRAMPNCETYILDEEGREVPPGELGELVVRGSNVMQGYWNEPELTAKMYRPGRIPREQWLYTGDYFKQDEDGFLYFLGRKDDMIKSRGERISPKDVENTLCEMPGVVEAAVIGVPDEIFGQVIKAFVASPPGSRPTERQVIDFCARNLENFMVPKYVEVIDSLPKTAHGKIDKKSLQ